MDCDKLVVFMDLDGVVADFGRAVEQLAEHFGFPIVYNYAHWDIFRRLGLSGEQCHQISDKIVEISDFWCSLDTIPCVDREILQKLAAISRKHILNILTSRPPAGNESVYSQTFRWLVTKMELSPINFNLLLADDKAPIVEAMHADVLIDDDPEYLTEFLMLPTKPKIFSPASTEQLVGVDYSGMLGFVDFCLDF